MLFLQICKAIHHCVTKVGLISHHRCIYQRPIPTEKAQRCRSSIFRRSIFDIDESARTSICTSSPRGGSIHLPSNWVSIGHCHHYRRRRFRVFKYQHASRLQRNSSLYHLTHYLHRNAGIQRQAYDFIIAATRIVGVDWRGE